MNRSFVVILAALATICPASLFAQAGAGKSNDSKPAPAAARGDGPARSADRSASKGDDARPKREAGRKADERKPGDKRADDKRPDDRKPLREGLAKAFAREHHPELASLLRTLESMSPEAYQSAVRDVARAAERLEALQDRDPERYERELEVWKTRSRVHVVSAEYRLSPGPDLEAKLRELMQDELRAKRSLLAFDQERTARRLEQIEREIRQIDEKGADLIDRQIGRLPGTAASTSTSRNKPKP